MIRHAISPETTGSNSVEPTTTGLSDPQPVEPRRKILVIDDDPVILKTLSLQLQSKGYQVVTASEGSEAIGAVREEQPDLMLMDVDFPPDVAHGGGIPWNGFLLAEWLRSINGAGNVPIIVISGNDRLEYRQRASASGAAAFLRKPIDSAELFRSIDDALDKKALAKSAKDSATPKSDVSSRAHSAGNYARPATLTPRQGKPGHFKLGAL